MKRVGRSVVSTITQTPASGPFGPVTTPLMLSLPTCCALAGAVAIPIAATLAKRNCLNVMPPSCRRQTQDAPGPRSRPRCLVCFLLRQRIGPHLDVHRHRARALAELIEPRRAVAARAPQAAAFPAGIRIVDARI